MVQCVCLSPQGQTGDKPALIEKTTSRIKLPALSVRKWGRCSSKLEAITKQQRKKSLDCDWCDGVKSRDNKYDAVLVCPFQHEQYLNLTEVDLLI